MVPPYGPWERYIRRGGFQTRPAQGRAHLFGERQTFDCRAMVEMLIDGT